MASMTKNDLLHKLYWREIRGCIKPRARSRHQRLFNKIPGRLGFSLKHLVPTSILEEGYVFLGFTKNGQFILSYSNQYTYESDLLGFPNYNYKLQVWLFVPHKPLKRVSEVCLFKDEKIPSELHLAVCEWPEDDSKIVVYGASQSTLGGESHCFVTIAAMPSLAPCPQCCAVTPDESDEDNLERTYCLHHTLTVHTKYQTTPPHPPFIPQIHLQIDGVLILNTGDTIIALEVKTFSDIESQNLCDLSYPYHKNLCCEKILPETCSAISKDIESDEPVCICEDPLGLSQSDTSDKVTCDICKGRTNLCNEGDGMDADSNVIDYQVSSLAKAGRLRRASDEFDRSAGYSSRHSSPRAFVNSPKTMFVSPEDKENVYSDTEEYNLCSPLTMTDSLCTCVNGDFSDKCVCTSEAITSSPFSQQDLMHISNTSPKSNPSAMSPKNDIYRMPLESPKTDCYRMPTQSPKTRPAVSPRTLYSLSQEPATQSQKSFFSPSSSTCSTRDSVVVYLNNPEFVSLVISKFAIVKTDTETSDADDTREINYHCLMPIIVMCEDTTLGTVKQTSSNSRYDVAVKQLTLDIEQYLGEIIRTQATWGHRFIDVLDYDVQVLYVCSSTCTVLCKVDVWVHARQDVLSSLPVRNSRKSPIILYKSSITYEWNISTGCLNTLSVDDIEQVDERTWRMSKPQSRQSELHSMRRRALVPQSYYRGVHVMTNAAVLRGKSLQMLLDVQHYVAILL